MNQPRLVGGRYQLLGQLGRGGMGVVWHARDTTIGREVAIKEVFLPPNLSEAHRAALRERTLHEARTAARIRHPAVVAVHDVIEDGGEAWIVMELVRGRSLDQIIRSGGPMSPPWAASVGLFVLSALDTAHAQGLLHRDVKPGNVLIADDGRVLLSDFGIATQAGGAAPGAPVGTPGYTAPECLTEEPGRAAGPASDLWSLGATIYTAVEGVPPFQRNSAMAVLGAVMTEPARPPQRAGALGQVLMALLAKDPAQRPDALALRHSLQQVTGTPPATIATPRPGWVVPRMAAVGSAAGVVVAFLVAVTLSLVLSSASAAEPLAATAPPSAPAKKPADRPSASTAPTPGASPTAAPSASPAEPLPPGKFSAIPRPCQLLTRQQAGELIGKYLTTSREPATQCIWSTASNTAPDNQQLAIYFKSYLYEPQGDGYETTLAKEHVLGAKAEADSQAGRSGSAGKQGEVFDIPGAGDLAAGWEVEKSNFQGKRTVEVHVVFATSNIVGEFRFTREVAKDPKLREKAAQAAKSLVENLGLKG